MMAPTESDEQIIYISGAVTACICKMRERGRGRGRGRVRGRGREREKERESCGFGSLHQSKIRMVQHCSKQAWGEPCSTRQ